MIERDPSWENVYASLKPVEADPDFPGVENWMEFRIEVTTERGYYWQKQRIHKDDLNFRWCPYIWDEMVKLMDERLDGKME